MGHRDTFIEHEKTDKAHFIVWLTSRSHISSHSRMTLKNSQVVQRVYSGFGCILWGRQEIVKKNKSQPQGRFQMNRKDICWAVNKCQGWNQSFPSKLWEDKYSTWGNDSLSNIRKNRSPVFQIKKQVQIPLRVKGHLLVYIKEEQCHRFENGNKKGQKVWLKLYKGWILWCLINLGQWRSMEVLQLG